MSNVRGHVVLAVAISSAVAALADLRPPSLEDTTAFIETAVRQHQAKPALLDSEERLWQLSAAFSGCSVETRVSSEIHRLGQWTSRARVARWHLQDTDADRIDVTDETSAGTRTFLVTLRCRGNRACVDRATQGRDDTVRLAFTSAMIGQRVAAAFRHAAMLCREQRIRETDVE